MASPMKDNVDVRSLYSAHRAAAGATLASREDTRGIYRRDEPSAAADKSWLGVKLPAESTYVISQKRT